MGSKGFKAKARLLLRARTFNPWYIMNRKLPNLNSCVHQECPKDFKTGFKSAVALQIKKLCGFKGCVLSGICKNLRNSIFANLQNLNSCVDLAWPKDSKTGFGSQIDPILREKIGFKVLENCWRLKGYPRSSRTEIRSAYLRENEYLMKWHIFVKKSHLWSRTIHKCKTCQYNQEGQTQSHESTKS